ncbi:MAG TPA: hypothetical protein VFN35_16980, partial [Ktedonobacteraceae bacterium]|nr:hypothetical protein [Ktedonobacteraceae bacterium]
LRAQSWWRKLHISLAYDDWIEHASPDRQLQRIAELDVPASIRLVIMTVLATHWVPNIFSYPSLRDRAYDRKHIIAPFMPAIALQKLATSPEWEIRYLIALHERTPSSTRETLSQDGNCYVRAMARAKAAQMREQEAV